MNQCFFTGPVGYEVANREQTFIQRFEKDPEPFFVPYNAGSNEEYKVTTGRIRRKSKSVFKMTSVPRGLVLVVVHNDELPLEDHFQTRANPYAKRHVDADKIIKLYKDLHFEIYRGTKHFTKTREDLSKLVKTFTDDERHVKLDSLVAFVFTPDRIDRQSMSVAQVFDMFVDMPVMQYKPIMLRVILSRCPGCYKKYNVMLKEIHEESFNRKRDPKLKGNDQSHVEVTVKKTGDIHYVGARIPAHRSMSTEVYGSWFVDAYVKLHARFAHCESDRQIVQRAIYQLGGYTFRHAGFVQNIFSSYYGYCSFSRFTLMGNIYNNPVELEHHFKRPNKSQPVLASSVRTIKRWIVNRTK